MTTRTAECELNSDVRAGVIDLLYRLADDNLVIGHRDSEWTGLAPILEADIAFSSMAQDKMGHALTYYRLLHDLSEAAPDTLAFGRSAQAYRSCSLAALPKGDWAFSLVRQVFFDEAQAVRLQAMAKCSYEPLAQVARKLAGELKYHTMHGRMWIARLGSATDESQTRLREAVEQLYPHALGMFEAGPSDGLLASSGVLPQEATLLDAWNAAVRPIFAEVSIQLPNGRTQTAYSRYGKQPEALTQMLDDMQKVYRLDPTAQW